MHYALCTIHNTHTLHTMFYLFFQALGIWNLYRKHFQGGMLDSLWFTVNICILVCGIWLETLNLNFGESKFRKPAVKDAGLRSQDDNYEDTVWHCTVLWYTILYYMIYYAVLGLYGIASERARIYYEYYYTIQYYNMIWYDIIRYYVSVFISFKFNALNYRIFYWLFWPPKGSIRGPIQGSIRGLIRGPVRGPIWGLQEGPGAAQKLDFFILHLLILEMIFWRFYFLAICFDMFVYLRALLLENFI